MADQRPRRALPTRRQRARAWYALVADVFTPQRLLLVLALAGIGIASLFGGWDAVSAEETAIGVADPRTPVSAAPFEVSARRARVADSVTTVLRREDGFRYLMVVADVTNTQDAHVDGSVLAQAAELDAPGLRTDLLSSGERTRRPLVLRLDDGLSQRTFQPGLTGAVILVWQQDARAPIPATVTMTLARHTQRLSSMDGSLGWFDPTPVAHVTLPVEPVEEA